MKMDLLYNFIANIVLNILDRMFVKLKGLRSEIEKKVKKAPQRLMVKKYKLDTFIKI